MGYQYNKPNYGNNGFVRQFNQNRPQKKKSGCKMGQNNGKPWIQAWNASKGRGLISLIASPAKKFKTKSKISDKWVVKLTIKRTLETKLYTGFYNTQTKKLTIPDLGMVANPSTNYLGTFSRRKN